MAARQADQHKPIPSGRRTPEDRKRRRLLADAASGHSGTTIRPTGPARNRTP